MFFFGGGGGGKNFAFQYFGGFQKKILWILFGVITKLDCI